MSSEDKYYVINGTLIHADQLEELYHAGRLGMKWGKHLPGTDWWKEALTSYYSNNNISVNKRVKDVDEKGKTTFRTQNPTLTQKIKANINVAGKAAKAYKNIAASTARTYRDKAIMKGYQLKRSVEKNINKASYKIKKGTSKLWNSGKGYTKDQIDKFQSSARKAYSKVRNAIIDYFNKSGAQFTGSRKMTSNTPLSEVINKQRRDAVEVYEKAMEDGGIMNTINLAIQTSQFNVSKGVNQFLKRIGMDDEVNAFMKKFGAKK